MKPQLVETMSMKIYIYLWKQERSRKKFHKNWQTEIWPLLSLSQHSPNFPYSFMKIASSKEFSVMSFETRVLLGLYALQWQSVAWVRLEKVINKCSTASGSSLLILIYVSKKNFNPRFWFWSKCSISRNKLSQDPKINTLNHYIVFYVNLSMIWYQMPLIPSHAEKWLFLPFPTSSAKFMSQLVQCFLTLRNSCGSHKML